MNAKLSLLFARRSVRAYADQPVPDEHVRDMLEAAMAAPSACCKDPWAFVVVNDRTRLRAIADGLPNGSMLGGAGVGIVVCGDTQTAHDGQESYLLQDCSAAIENLLLAASTLGLGACWLGVHPREDRIQHLRRLLELPEHILPVAAIAVGWPAEDKAPRTRYDAAKVRRERWGTG
jgi:nitroreductase